MSNLIINANSIYDRVIKIGRQAENLVSSITFNVQMWIDEYGTGECVLNVKRNGDANAYPVPMTITDGLATWTITDVDTAKKGRGEIQLFYTVGEKVKTSPIFTISCGESLVAGEVPEPYENLLTELNQMIATTEANARRAEDAAERAEAAADGGGEGGGGGTLRPATTERLGSIIVGEDLQITPLGVLSVIKANRAEQDNTHPITAAAVFTEIGNIDALLQTI